MTMFVRSYEQGGRGHMENGQGRTRERGVDGMSKMAKLERTYFMDDPLHIRQEDSGGYTIFDVSYLLEYFPIHWKYNVLIRDSKRNCISRGADVTLG